MSKLPYKLAITTLIFAAGAHGVSQKPRWTEQERALLKSMSLSSLEPLAPDPSNKFGDDPRAAALGEALFFDTRLSGNGKVSCATCHVPGKDFQDGTPLGHGVGTTGRRTMPIAGTAHNAWFFWDGRASSQWEQALGPLESAVEHGGTRTEYAHVIAEHYRGAYEATFGSLRRAAMMDSTCVVSATFIRAARMAGDTCTSPTACDCANSARRARMRDTVVFATLIDRYAPDPIAATPSRSSRKPTTIRSRDSRRWGAGMAFGAMPRGLTRLKLAPKKYPWPPMTGAIVPLIVAPLLAVKAADAPGICVLVAVTICTPAVGDSVHVTLALPSLSVVVDGAESLPPPVTVQVIGTPATDLFAPSSACTTIG